MVLAPRRQLEGGSAEPEQFAHRAWYNAAEGRIEMHLVSRRAQWAHIGDEAFHFAAGEAIHTENSYKFTIEGLHALAVRAGFRPGPVWTDADRMFSVHWLHAPA